MTSEDLAEHANKVMTTLDDGIRGLDDMDAFFEYLYQVGGSHTRIAGFKAEYFWVSFFFFISFFSANVAFIHIFFYSPDY